MQGMTSSSSSYGRASMLEMLDSKRYVSIDLDGERIATDRSAISMRSSEVYAGVAEVDRPID